MLSFNNWNKKSSKIGKLLHTWVAYIFGIIVILGGANEVIQTFPSEWIPEWVKITVLISAIVSYVGGKMTKEENCGNKA